jgi:hypothetical protein
MANDFSRSISRRLHSAVRRFWEANGLAAKCARAQWGDAPYAAPSGFPIRRLEEMALESH